MEYFIYPTTKIIPKLSPLQKRRFLEKVRTSDSGCREWYGNKDNRGYGVVKLNGIRYSSHRVAFSMYSNLDTRLTIDHICRNKLCVNFKHLQQVTQQKNSGLSSIRSGRSTENKKKTYMTLLFMGVCKNGHPIKTLGDIHIHNSFSKNEASYSECRICKNSSELRRKRRIRKK